MHARQVRMMAWGAMGNAHAVMQGWSEIAKARGTIELGTGDWFFLPDRLWESPEFWETLLRAVGRIFDFCLYSPTSECQGPPELHDRQVPRVPWQRVYKWAIEFHLARTRGDEGALRHMCKEFPRWRDPRLVLELLSGSRRPPTRHELLAACAPGSETTGPEKGQNKGHH